VACTWLINRNTAFRAGAGDRALHHEGALYLAVQTAGAGLNYAVFCALLFVAPTKGGWTMLAALAIASGVAMIFNYFAMRRFVFSPRRKGLA
jgi:putative flippase GtrA